jgi:HTH-type transcriptional regulator/antitoxin HigA
MAATITVPVIRTDADLAEALKRIDAIIDAPEGTIEAEERTILALIVHEYEARRYPLSPATGLDLLRHLMTSHGLSQADLPEIGPQPLVSAVLTGKRKLNTRMIGALAKRFQVSPGAFFD